MGWWKEAPQRGRSFRFRLIAENQSSKSGRVPLYYPPEDGPHQPTPIEVDGRRVKLRVGRGKRGVHRDLLYTGMVPVYVAGPWRKGLSPKERR